MTYIPALFDNIFMYIGILYPNMQGYPSILSSRILRIITNILGYSGILWSIPEYSGMFRAPHSIEEYTGILRNIMEYLILFKNILNTV
jgi:hypothetical protein